MARMASAISATTPPARSAETEHAALAILRLSHEHAGKLLLVALGPLTNLALALKLDPTLPTRIARLVVMGGAVTAHGNITAAAEFNIAFDPEAAHIVFDAFPRIDLVDWEAVMAHGFPHAALRALAAGAVDARPLLRRDLAQDARLGRRPPRRPLAFGRCAGDGATPCSRRARWKSPSARWPSNSRAATPAGATIVDWRREEGRPDNAGDPAALRPGRVRGAAGRGAGGRVGGSAFRRLNGLRRSSAGPG